MENRSVAGRKLAILADGHLDFHFGKTAIGVLRYRENDVVAVIDHESAGKTAQHVVGVGGDTPIVATVAEAIALGPDTLLIGVATRGGMIPNEWREPLMEAISHGLDVICGLHYFLSDDPEIAAAAAVAGVRLIDVRKPPDELAVAEAKPRAAGGTVITMVGSDCAVGKMSVALDIEAEARNQGVDAQFVATGQTGMMISGNGIPLDRIIGDFMSGAVEAEVDRAAAKHSLVLVEGQGSLIHPAYSGVTLALIHGSRPDAMILTVMPSRSIVEDYEIEIPSVLDLIEMHESAAGWIKPAPVIAIAVNSLGLTEDQSRRALEIVAMESGLPTTDSFRYGASLLVKTIREFRSGRRYGTEPIQSSEVG